MSIRFADIPFEGEAIATLDGKVIWTNFYSGDCPPDVAMMFVKNIYMVDGQFVFELSEKGE